MSGSRSLTLYFIEQKPAAAARALNTLSAENAADYLNSIPAGHAQRVLARIGTWSASRIMSRMAVEQSAAVIRKLPYLDGAAVLRMMRPEPREALLAVLPTRLKRDFEGSLAFPESTVGGQMTTDFIALEAHHTLGEAGDALRKASQVETDVIFVTDAGRHYLGALPLTALFRFPRSAMIESAIEIEVKPLSARQQMASVLDLPDWNQVSSLPVVSRQQHLIGSLSVRQLHAASTRVESSPKRLRTGGLLQMLVGEYVDCAAELAQFVGAGAPADSRSKRAR